VAGAPRTSVRSGKLGHSTPRVPDVSSTIFAHSSPFSLPATPLYAGHHHTSMTIPGLDWRNMEMCFRARRACSCPGPGSSDAIRLIAACASEDGDSFWDLVPLRRQLHGTGERSTLGIVGFLVVAHVHFDPRWPMGDVGGQCRTSSRRRSWEG